MTIHDLIELADDHPFILLTAFLLPPLLTVIIGLIHGRDNGRLAPWKYIYSVLVYMICPPGLFAAVITAYTMFFSKANLLDVSILGHFVPIISMIVTLVLIRKRVSFDDVPGFDRLSGLMAMIGCSFIIALAIDKTRIFIGFFGSIDRLFLLAAGIFALLKWGTYMLFRSNDEPKEDMPDLTGRDRNL